MSENTSKVFRPQLVPGGGYIVEIIRSDGARATGYSGWSYDAAKHDATEQLKRTVPASEG